MPAIALLRPLLVVALVAAAVPAIAQQAAPAPVVITEGPLDTFAVPRALAAFAIKRARVPAPDSSHAPQWGSPGYPVPPAFYPMNVPFQARGPLNSSPHIVPGPGLVPTAAALPGS
jgi:hypothetical protein